MTIFGANQTNERRGVMDNQTSIEGQTIQPKQAITAPMAPEAGLIYGSLLTPIAGAIFWSINWKRLGRPQHRWWTWATAMIVLISYFGSFLELGNIWIGLILLLGWQYLIYGLQRKIAPPGVRSIAALVAAIILSLGQIAFGFYTMRPDTQGGVGSSVTIGTSYDKNSPSLSVSGDQYTTGTTLYARIHSSKRFGATNVMFLLEQQQGAAWHDVLNQPIPVSPNYDTVLEKFYVTAPGTYRIEGIVNDSVIADSTFDVSP